jgi:hypothetical protein
MTAPIPNVDNTTLNNLIPNLDIGDVADPALRLAAFQYIYTEVQTIITAYNAFVANGGIATSNLADLSVTTAKLALLSVTAAQIANATITAAQIANGTITSTQIGLLGVANANLATGIDPTKLADGSVNATEFQYINSLTSNAQNQLDAKIPLTQRAAANGVATLDSGAKIPISQLPDSIVGQLEYQGTWNASTNTPTLAAPSTVKGYYYVVSVAGTYLSIPYAVGDWIVSNGTTWDKVDNTDAVTTVFGRLGAIVPNANDYTWAQIDKTVSSFADITTRSASDINTGTLPVSQIPTGIPASSIGSGSVDNPHYAYLASLTSDPQVQLNNKAPLSHVGAGGSSQHPDATPSQSGFISAADLIAFRALTPTGLGTYAIPVGQILSFWGRYSIEQDATTGEMVIYEI